ncbi:MAG: Crp/Fnr family transcriptional regulator [Bacillota bacterium]
MDSTYVSAIVEMPLFRGFTEAGAQRLLDLGEVKEHAPGEQLCAEGDPADRVLLILTGKLRVYVERAGSDLVLGDFGPGAILGEIAVLCGIPRATSARAIERSVVLCWSEQAFHTLMFGDAFLSHRILRNSLRFLIDHEKSLIESLVQERVADQAI